MRRDNLTLPGVLLEPIDNYNTDELVEFMKTIYPAMIHLVESKDKNYGGSWQEDGLIGVHANFKRKTNRIETQFYNGTLGSVTNEDIGDTFVDSANYNVMYLFFLYKKYPHIREQIGDFQTKFLCQTKQ